MDSFLDDSVFGNGNDVTDSDAFSPEPVVSVKYLTTVMISYLSHAHVFLHQCTHSRWLTFLDIENEGKIKACR